MNRLILVICSFYLPITVFGQERIDHVGLIKSLGDNDAKVGQAIYRTHCASCHGQDGELALNPLARRFAKDKLKFGSDPYSLWKTISYGNGLMFRWDTVLSAKERYQIAIPRHDHQYIVQTNQFEYLRHPTRRFQTSQVYYLLQYCLR